MAPQPNIVVQVIKDVTVATIGEASVVEPQQVEALRAVLFDLIDKKDRRKLIIDLSKVKNLSSAALGVFVPLREKFAKAKGSLILVGVSPQIMTLFTLTKLHKMFQFAATEDDALHTLGVTIPR